MKLLLTFLLFVVSVKLSCSQDLDLENDCFCRLRPSSRIVGGQVANQNHIPWMASVQKVLPDSMPLRTKHLCGALREREEKDFKVRVGLHFLNDITEELTVELIYRNTFIPSTREGDIAILKLRDPINFRPGEVEPACFDFSEKTYENKIVMASGWGRTERQIEAKQGGEKIIETELSPVLKFADFKVITERCNTFNICIDSANKGPESTFELPNSACMGDSGGPLHLTLDGLTSVEGILSVIERTGTENYWIYCTGIGFFSRLSFYKNWILSFIGENNYCPLSLKLN